MSQPANAQRYSVKLHRRVSFLWTEDALLAEEILARKKLVGEICGRLSEQVLLVRAGRMEVVIAELQAMGQTPKVIGRTPTAVAKAPSESNSVEPSNT